MQKYIKKGFSLQIFAFSRIRTHASKTKLILCKKASLKNILQLVVRISGSQPGGPSFVPFLSFSFDSYLPKSTKKEILVLFC